MVEKTNKEKKPQKKPAAKSDASLSADVHTKSEVTLDPNHKESDRKSTREGFSKVIEKIPIVGPTLAFILDKWEWIGLLLFLVGFSFALSLVFFGVLPEKLISDSYKQVQRGEKTPLDIQKDPPHGSIKIQTVAVDDARQWLQQYIRLFTLEGQELDPNLRISPGAVEHVIQEPTNRSFFWSLEAIPNYQLEMGVGFRVTKEGLIQPLESKTDGNSIRFTVPTCDKDDKLIAIVLVTWKDNLEGKELSQLLTSKAT